MKTFATAILFFLSCIVIAQDVNQLDPDGNRHGIWEKKFDGTNQIRYLGEFNHGKEIGLFKYYELVKKKSVLSATKQFNKNDNLAYVKFLAANGKIISEGKMNGKLNVGEWKYYHGGSNKIMTIENYNDDGQLNGDRVVYYKDGKIAEESHYITGSLEGVSRWFSPKGIEIKTFVYEKNELHGMSKYFSDEGELLAEGLYKRGRKTGVWKYYNNGKLVKEEDFTYTSKLKKKQ